MRRGPRRRVTWALSFFVFGLACHYSATAFVLNLAMISCQCFGLPLFYPKQEPVGRRASSARFCGNVGDLFARSSIVAEVDDFCGHCRDMDSVDVCGYEYLSYLMFCKFLGILLIVKIFDMLQNCKICANDRVTY